MANIKEIEGIGPAYAEKLKQAGIVTVQTLLKKGASPKGRQEIVAKTGIGKTLILRWVNHADLFRVKGVGAEYAELLEAAGVDTIPELAKRKPGNLHQKLVQVNQDKKLVRQLPAQKQVEDWIKQATQLPRVVKY